MRSYAAPWWLPGGNLQTLWAALHARRFSGPPPSFRRERWLTPDADFVDVDWVDDAPTLPTSCGSLPPEGALRLRTGKAGSAAPAGAGGDGEVAPALADEGAAFSEPELLLLPLGEGGDEGLPEPACREVAPTLPTPYGSLPPEGAAAPAVRQSRPCGPGLQGDAASTLLIARDSLIPKGVQRLSPDEAGFAVPADGWSAPALPAVGDLQRPLLVLFHGLEGSSGSHYAQAFADVAQRRGWACAVPHFRGCSGELNLAPRAYHSGDFVEIDWVLRRFARQHAGPVVAVGVSLGGNALMRWAGEMGSRAAEVVSAVASVCAPLDLAASGAAIGQGFNRQVYTRMFLKSMVPKALQKLAQHPGLFSRADLLAARDLYAFDDVFTGPLHGFTGVDDYWKRASALPHLGGIGVPALVLNALNDPFIPAASLPQPGDVSRWVTLWQPKHGGHVGFPAAAFPAHVQAMPEAVLAFLAAQLTEPASP